jgi:hypothetical protein
MSFIVKVTLYISYCFHTMKQKLYLKVISKFDSC